MTATTQRVELVPIFEDNYVFVLIDEGERRALVVDPGEETAVEEFLRSQNLQLDGILVTHHHNDHVGGIKSLVSTYKVPVYAPIKNKNQIPYASEYVKEGDRISLGRFFFEVIETPGHTLGHVAYWNPDKKWLFSGDVIFGLGCGRLFEGTHQQMYDTLQRIKDLPQETQIFCTHEYTEANLQFCKILTNADNSPITGDDENLEMYENELMNRRNLGLPSVPLKLFIEGKVNPFLLAKNVQQFKYLRELRDKQ